MKQPLPLLILDLDETLIYGAEREGLRPCDFRVGPFHVYKRPHLDAFLSGVVNHYRLAIWSSASSDYVGEIAHQILPAGSEWAFVWSRERCTTKRNLETFETEYVKDLKKVKRAGYDLARVLVVDDTRHKVARNYGNAICIAPFEGDPADEELPLLLKYLESLSGRDNFRAIEKRGWRSKVAVKKFIPSDLQWLAPWEVVEDGAALEAELGREIVDGHPLYGLPAVAVGRRVDCDDVLFQVDDPSYALAVVHLTWRMGPEPDPMWPHTILFHDWEEWIEKCLKPDHVE